MLEKHFHTIIEPFHIKAVEPIRFTTREQRSAALAVPKAAAAQTGSTWSGALIAAELPTRRPTMAQDC
jgi:hypothetical protein